MTENPTFERVRTRLDALQRLRDARGVVVGTHQGPDADGIGSGMALVRGLRALGTPAWMTLDEPLDPRNEFFARELQSTQPDRLPLVGEQVHDLVAPIDLCVVVDTGRVPSNSHLRAFCRERDLPVLVVDHHLHSGDPDTDIVVISSASSAEVVFAILRALDAPVDALTAQWLYTATSYDTGSFRFLRDSASTFRLAATWAELGADPVQAQVDLYQNASWDGRQFLARALGRAQRDVGGALASVALAPEDWVGLDVDRDDFRDLIQQLISVRGVEIAATIVAEPAEDRTRLSFRARSGWNLEPLARRYGGGGHAQACGATVKGTDLANWSAKVRHALRRVLDAGQ